MKTIIESTVSKITTMADRSVRLQIDTQELNALSMAEVFAIYGKIGYFLFSENTGEIEQINVTNLPPVVLEKTDKSPSVRLRAVMYVLWQQTQNTTAISSEEFYRLELEKLITHYKNKLTN